MEVTEIRLPAGARAVRLREWKVEPGALVQVDSVVAVCVTIPTETERNPEEQPNRRVVEKKLKSDRAGVVRELCYQLGEVISPGGHKRKLQDAREVDDDGDMASQSSKESNEDGSSSEADEMAAALEAELNDFM
ncbi:RNA polymerase II subunit A C-terminal domain phosphatase [Bagarius yarrelli]|uniref:RNA polymerase II subunit A C-terminal domain phosphatase n=1 Tax=Bagarius yarrelli TaxID=175774 RepID=A0A556U8J6_BAGYA|nr:RNA polymerase II subunit A C-terminal domain phosphatase [Bagarius yarrelli]